ncbi:patatin-like phospholipase family protein [Microbacterium sp. CFBP9034]|uniref:patatin-like phospholipase family protein n=1 Tax=Microbacterium sp. CFBP9034 TaxID=3096540 RepID=UPI002A69B3DE|nr:patatin-like phospholipase family protein [Microbacterium sp. CFBP9034]MDY0910880.1 patatin-like phospholipase family protein [Microbacterium sp. CFBP9034]
MSDDPGRVSADPTLGLTLGGGGAFGAAHVGVLQVLAERGIRPGIATGTSSGALVAAAYAAGLELSVIEQAVLQFRWRAIARWSLSPRWGLLDTHAVTDAVSRVFGTEPLIEDLPLRFGAVATDLRARRTVTIDSGPLSVALRATIAVPGLLPPVRRHGTLLADGGMLDNVPVGPTRAMGAERVVVVRLHARWENVRMMRTVTRTADLADDPSVLLIQPEMEGMAQWMMSDVPRLIAEGRRAATVALDAAALDGRFLGTADPDPMDERMPRPL